MLDLRQLVVLRAIATEGSLAAAARHLHFSQPTVTHHLTALESHIGTPLVARGARGTALTAAGEAFLVTAHRVLDTLDEGVAAVRVAVEQTPLRIGTFRTAGALLVAPTIASARRKGTVRSRVELIHGPFEVHLDWVSGGQSDCAVVYSFDKFTHDAVSGLVIELLAVDPYRVVVHADHRLASADGPVGLARLSEDGWITRDRAGEADDAALAAACQGAGFVPRVALREDDYSVATAFLASGGAMLLPHIYRQSDSGIVDLPVSEPLGGRSIYFVSRKAERREEIKLVRDGVREQLRILLGDANRATSAEPSNL